MQIKGIHHIAIKIKSEQFDRVTGFYKNLLGLKEVRSWGSGNNRAVMISTGDNSVLEIMSNAADEVPSEGALRHIALTCDDPDGFAKLLKDNGYEVIITPRDVVLECVPPYPVRICFVKGPAGEIIEFFEEK